jgi:IclR family acetate operon transcriptional repressor
MRTIEAFAKGLRVLEYALKHGEFRIGEMASAVNIPSSNATLFLNTLMEAGYVRRGEVAGLYRVTERLLSLFDKAGPTLYDSLRKSAENAMRRLQGTLNENVLLAVMDGDFTTHYIAQLVADHVVQVRPSADEHFPIHLTAHGKAILAFQPEDLIEKHIEVHLKGASPPVSKGRLNLLREELHVCREAGYAVNRGEYEEHTMAIAAPVLFASRAIASIVVQLPKFRHEESELERYGKVVAEAARTASDELAGRLG